MISGLTSVIFSRMKSSKAGALRAESLLCAAVLACFAAGCAGDESPRRAEPSPRAWVGEVQGTDIKVALADRGDSVALFFCGGDDSYTDSTRWFSEGALLGEPFSFTEDGWSIDGGIDERVFSGSLKTDIETDIARNWMAEPVAPGTVAGLYEGDAPCGKLGLIVTQATVDDAPTGQGACLRVENSDVIVEQVNPVRLELSPLRELFVTVASAPDETFTVRPVASAPQ